MPKITFSFKTLIQVLCSTCTRQNCLDQNLSALFTYHIFFLAFIKVPSSTDLSRIELCLTCSASTVSWLPDGGSKRLTGCLGTKLDI